MTVAANKVVAAFDALAPEEQRQVAVEILRRSANSDEMSGDAFDRLAAEVFGAYDAEESSSASG